jgi:hypothetical protein
MVAIKAVPALNANVYETADPDAEREEPTNGSRLEQRLSGETDSAANAVA